MDVDDNTKFDRALPGASALLESLRGVGYSTWTAIADLVDNSIAAEALRIRIDFVWCGADSFVRILDDGQGMDAAALVAAMRPGSRNPRESRGSKDLGRFGLGLKTASLSQCRVLTVVSKTANGTVSRHWDLDHVDRVDDWQLLKGVPQTCGDEVLFPADVGAGTLVLWTRLDRLVGSSDESDVDARERFFETARHVERHIAMTHHRFLEGVKPSLQIFFNGEGEQARVKPWDPFMQWHPATIASPPERISFGGRQIEVQGFVLPHRDRLTSDEFEAGGGPEGWLAHEGFFVYRAERLLVYGGWLSLGAGRRWARDDLHRLARIRIDIPNTTDADWKIDIRKSLAIPPAAVRSRLRGLTERVRADAREVLAHRGGRGSRTMAEPLTRAWTAHESSRGISYLIERTHPSVKRVLDAHPDTVTLIEDMIRVIEATVPVQRIWLDATERGDVHNSFGTERPDATLDAAMKSLRSHLINELRLAPAEARRRLLAIEPFNKFPGAVAELFEGAT